MRSGWLALTDAERARLSEFAARAAQTGQAVFTPFLAVPEVGAQAAAGAGCAFDSFGGFEGAERRRGCFWSGEGDPPAGAQYPLRAVAFAWSAHDDPPAHRDLLGALLGLGIVRDKTGDVLIRERDAVAFVDARMASFVAESLTGAGRTRLSGRVLPELPEVAPPEGVPRRDTVPSLRLDAVLAAALNLSRGRAAEIVAAGGVKVNQAQTLRADLRLEPGDMISIRGHGRVRLQEVGIPTRKGRLPIAMTCFGLNGR